MKSLKTILIFGSLGGTLALLSSTAISRMAIYFDEESLFYVGYLVILIMPICTYLALRDIKSHVYEGKLPLFPALISGLLVSLLAFMIFSGLKFLEDVIFEDRYQQYLIENTIESMKNEGATSIEIREKVKAIKERYNSWIPIKNRFRWYMTLGAIYTIASIVLLKYIQPILRKNEK